MSEPAEVVTLFMLFMAGVVALAAGVTFFVHRLSEDREIRRAGNAAINLKNLAVSSTVSACGEEGSGSGRKTRTKPASVKQESSSKATYG